MKWNLNVSMALLIAGSLVSYAQTTAITGNAAPVAPHANSDGTVAADTRTEKQKALARQTEQLFDMATELKVEVDKTNKNILSLKVVQQAEEIEMLAKGMKDHSKR